MNTTEQQPLSEWARALIEWGWKPSRDGEYMISPATGVAVNENGDRIEPLQPVAR